MIGSTHVYRRGLRKKGGETSGRQDCVFVGGLDLMHYAASAETAACSPSIDPNCHFEKQMRRSAN